MTTMENLPEVVSREEWLAARKELLLKEKELTQARDRVNADRRRLPMVRIDKPYTFEGPNGTVSLLDLFEGRPQLVMHHFMWMFDVDADGTGTHATRLPQLLLRRRRHPPALRQLHVRNTTLVAVTRAPYDNIAAFRERMGWTFPWYSSWGSDFNYDFHATVDDRVAPVLVRFRTEAELAAAGTPWGRDGGCVATGRASAHSCASRTRSSTPTPRLAVASRSSTTASPTSTSPHSAARRHGRNRRAAPPRSACTSAAPTYASPTNTTRRDANPAWSLTVAWA